MEAIAQNESHGAKTMGAIARNESPEAKTTRAITQIESPEAKTMGATAQNKSPEAQTMGAIVTQKSPRSWVTSTKHYTWSAQNQIHVCVIWNVFAFDQPIEQTINIAQYTRVAQSGKIEESEVFMFFLTGKLFFNQSPFTEQDHSTKSNVS